MLTLATFSLPAYEVATSSSIGAIILHGPHHSAQKSTSTGSLDFSTCSSNWSSLTWAIAALTFFSDWLLFTSSLRRLTRASATLPPLRGQDRAAAWHISAQAPELIKLG